MSSLDLKGQDDAVYTVIDIPVRPSRPDVSAERTHYFLAQLEHPGGKGTPGPSHLGGHVLMAG